MKLNVDEIGRMRDLVGCGRSKSFDSGLLEGVSRNGLVQLAEACVRAINWLKWDQLWRIWREVQSVFLFLPSGLFAMLQLIGGAGHDGHNFPWASEGVLQLVNSPPSLVRPHRSSGKSDMVRALSVDKLPVVIPVFLYEQFGHFAGRCQAHSKVLRVCGNSGGGRNEFPMLPSGVVNRKGEFATDGNETAGNICPRNGTRVPRV